MIIPIYLFVVALPSYYMWSFSVPETDSLRRTEGSVEIKDTGEQGILFGLEVGGKTRWFTCSVYEGFPHDCSAESTLNSSLGSRAVVWWFERQTSPVTSQNQAVRIVVNGSEVMSREDALNRAVMSRTFAVWYSIGMLVFVVLVVVIFEKIKRKLDHG